MTQALFLILFFAVLGYGFWLNSDFKLIAAGVAIFLVGMLWLEEGLKSFSGSTLQTILERCSNRIYKSIAFGVVTTSIVQSSSLISILTISFLSAGLMGLSGAIGIVFGANLGTTTGAWLVAGLGLKVDIAAYAMPMLVFGVVLVLQKSHNLKGVGYILAGLGFLFLGIAYMKEGFEAFKTSIDIAQFSMGGIKGLLIYTLVGMVATVVMQSSHATLMLIITALFTGQISYENALALAIGANIGTTVSALMASIGSSIEGKRLAVAHLIFNALTALIALVFIKQFIEAVDFLSLYLGIANDNYTLKLALFHTLFNLVGVVTLLPFIHQLVAFLEKFITQPKSHHASIDSVMYLNNAVLELPHTAMVALHKESKHLYENGFKIIAKGLNLKPRHLLSSMELDEVVVQPHDTIAIDIDDHYKRRIKGIYGDIIDFATKAQVKLSDDKINAIYQLKLANRDTVEAIKNTKHLQKNMLKYSQSHNIYIKEQYDLIRKNLAQLLRTIHIIASTNEKDFIELLLAKSTTQMQLYDIVSNGVLDGLIRKGLITNEMATSLMNDSTYAYNIAKSLIAMAQILFGQMRTIDADDLNH